MKTFMYRGYHRDGNRCKGIIEAHDLKDAREKLSHNGILPELVESVTNQRPGDGYTSGMRNSLDQIQNRTEFYRALAALLKAGLPMASAFEVMIDQPPGEQHHATRHIAGIRDRVREGMGFAHAMTDASIRISAYESAVIESGEKTGRMPDVIEQVADYLDDIANIRTTLVNASIYPMIIVLLSILVGAGVMGFLVPQMASLFEESGMELPLITRMVVNVGRWFIPVILPVMTLVAITGYFGYRFVRQSSAARQGLERYASRFPFVQTGFRLLVTARFSRTCALLLRGGLPLVEAMALSGRATGSVWLSRIIDDKADAVRHGQSFSAAMAEVPVLGAAMTSWIRAGEASGDLAGLLQHAAQRNHYQWSGYIRKLSTMIEPALIVVVALFVLVIALAIILPILSLNQQVM